MRFGLFVVELCWSLLTGGCWSEVDFKAGLTLSGKTRILIKQKTHNKVLLVIRSDPDCQFSQIGSCVVDDGLEHVVPEGHADRVARPLHLRGHEEGTIAGALKTIINLLKYLITFYLSSQSH